MSSYAESARLPKIDFKARRAHFFIQTKVSRSFGFNPILRPTLRLYGACLSYILSAALGFTKISVEKSQKDERKIKNSILLEISTEHSFNIKILRYLTSIFKPSPFTSKRRAGTASENKSHAKHVRLLSFRFVLF